MLEELSNLGSSDPNLRKAAACNVLKHLNENKKDLEHLVRRLVHGLESTKIHTRSGCYTTLTVLLQLRKLLPNNLYESMQKALITNKQSTKKERRLIYIARILCLGSIIKSVKAADLIKPDGLLGNLVHEIVELCTKKSSYFQLATPFLTHLLSDNSLTQEDFDNIVWPEVKILFDTVLKAGSKKRKNEEDDEEEQENQEDEEIVAVNFGCCVQLALVCKNGTYKEDFDCLGDIQKITKALLVCKFQFEDVFLKSLFHFIKNSTAELEMFWNTLLDGLKPTQFELLCLSVTKAFEEGVSPGSIVSKRLLHYLLSVFKTKDHDFISKAKSTLQVLLKWDDKEGKSLLGKKERKATLKCLFGGEPPNILHEYAKLNPIVRSFINSLKEKDLANLREILFTNFEDENLGVRMAIVYLNVLVRLAVSKRIGDESMFEICKKLVCVAVGKDVIEIKKKSDAEEEDDELDQEESQIQLKATALEGVKTIMANTYNIKFMESMWEFFSGEVKEFGNEKTIQVVKVVKKALKKVESPHFRYLITAYALRVLLDEKEAISSSLDGVTELVELANGGMEGDVVEEIVRFITSKVVRDNSPCISIEGMFTRLMIEGLVKEEVVQELANSVEIEVDEGEGEEDDDDDSDEEDEDGEGMDVDAESDSEDDEGPSAKKTKLDPAQIAKLKEVLGAGEGSDSEESVALEDATNEELEKTNEQLAKIFAIKKLGKDEDNSQLRAIMRSLRLIDVYVVRNIKCIGVSSLLILLMPVINCLKTSLKLKKFSDVTTRVMGVVDNLCRVKKFSGVEELVEGTLGSIATELYEIGKARKYKILRELMEHCVLMIIRCFLASEKSKKDSKAILKLVSDAVDSTSTKLKRRKKRKMKGKNAAKQLETSRFVRLVLETIGDGWKSGRKKIEARINEVKDGVVNGK